MNERLTVDEPYKIISESDYNRLHRQGRAYRIMAITWAITILGIIGFFLSKEPFWKQLMF